MLKTASAVVVLPLFLYIGWRGRPTLARNAMLLALVMAVIGVLSNL